MVYTPIIYICPHVLRILRMRFNCFDRQSASLWPPSSLEQAPSLPPSAFLQQTSVRKMPPSAWVPFSPFCSAICGGCLALALSALDVRAAEAETSGIREQLLQQERDRWLQQQQLESKPQQPPPSPSIPIPDYPEQETPCFTLHSIGYANPEAETRAYRFALEAVTTGKGNALGRCLGSMGLSNVLMRVQQALIKQGYVNTHGQHLARWQPGISYCQCHRKSGWYFYQTLHR